ncbi:MAG: HEPN domain-containing protein [Firmicutes bacterium]|nr:HEPN domain-containing protein [Bacillota bacterium]
MGKAEDFFRLAENDLKVARLILESANDELMQNSAAYNVEQAVEKLMKGLIVKGGGIAGISHNIIELSKDMDELGIDYPRWINEKDDDITSWATTIRYNANFKADHDDIKQVIENTEEWIKELTQR